MKQLGFHPLADLFPLMEGDEREKLVADIKQIGLLHPITLLDGKIIDGRNRYRACLEADVPLRTNEYEGEDPLAFVISNNLHRRHLDESQRAMTAAKLATMKPGRQWITNPPNGGFSQDQAAATLNVSKRAVQRAAVVRNQGTAELVHCVEQGGLPVSVAAEIAQLPGKRQRDIVALPVEKRRSIAKAEAKRVKRAAKERALGEATRRANAMLGKGDQRYNVLMADPPWRFEPFTRETGLDRAADNHYPTITVDKLLAMRPPVAADAVLFLWATVPMLREGLAVMEAWSFDYKSHLVWAKGRSGTGYWNRNVHELLLIGTRGKVPAPAPGTQPPSIIELPATEHSVKPPGFAELIEGMFPNLPALEMFARSGPRLGWDVWGNEAEAA